MATVQPDVTNPIFLVLFCGTVWCYIEISKHTLNMSTQVTGMVCSVQDNSVISQKSQQKLCDWLSISSKEMRQFCHGIWCILTWQADVVKSEVQVSAYMPSQITSEQRSLARNAISRICSDVTELQRVNKENSNYARFIRNLSPQKKNLQRLNASIFPNMFTRVFGNMEVQFVSPIWWAGF